MKKLMLLLLMIISIIPLISCKEENNVKWELGYNSDNIYYRKNGERPNLKGRQVPSRKDREDFFYTIETDKDFYNLDEIITITLNLEGMENLTNENIIVRMLEDDCFEVIGNMEYFINIEDIKNNDHLTLEFKIKAINKSFYISKLTILTEFMPIDRIYCTSKSQFLYSFSRSYERENYHNYHSYLYYVVDEMGSFFTGTRPVEVNDESYTSYNYSIFYSLNRLYKNGYINKTEYMNRATLMYSGSGYYFNKGVYCSKNIRLSINFTNEKSNKIFDVIAPNDLLYLAYENGYLTEEIYKEELRWCMTHYYFTDYLISFERYITLAEIQFPHEYLENIIIPLELSYSLPSDEFDEYISEYYDVIKFDYDGYFEV